MRWLVWLLLAFAVAVGLSLLLRFNQGNVAIMWPPYRIDISVNLALALLASLSLPALAEGDPAKGAKVFNKCKAKGRSSALREEAAMAARAAAMASGVASTGDTMAD